MSDALRVALVGNPNCGKTSLFNHLTGTRQKVGNYAGVTVERKVGQFSLPSGQAVRILDLPGTYSLDATSPDEMITRDVVMGKIADEGQQDAFLCVVDATNLKLHLGLVIELIALGRPMLIVLNMMDEARRRARCRRRGRRLRAAGHRRCRRRRRADLRLVLHRGLVRLAAHGGGQAPSGDRGDGRGGRRVPPDPGHVPEGVPDAAADGEHRGGAGRLLPVGVREGGAVVGERAVVRAVHQIGRAHV